MKNVLTLIFFLVVFTTPGKSQLTQLHNHPRTGDELIKWQVEYKSPGPSAGSQLWDFSSLTPVNSQYELTYTTPGMIGDSLFMLAGDTMPVQQVAEDVLLAATEHYTTYYYRLRNDTLFRLGHENPNTRLSYHRPMAVMKYPINYGDVLLSDYSGQGHYSGQVEVNTRGTQRVHADAWGSMILPSGDTLSHVLRIKTTQAIQEATSAEDSVNALQYTYTRLLETHQWYTKGYRYPVFETVRSIHLADSTQTFATAFFYPPQEHYYLQSDPHNTALLDSLWNIKSRLPDPLQDNDYRHNANGINYRVYPNPVKNYLNIHLTLTKEAAITILLYDINGRLLHHSPKAQYEAGSSHHRIDCTRFSTGTYLLKIYCDEEIFSHKIIKANE